MEGVGNSPTLGVCEFIVLSMANVMVVLLRVRLMRCKFVVVGVIGMCELVFCCAGVGILLDDACGLLLVTGLVSWKLSAPEAADGLGEVSLSFSKALACLSSCSASLMFGLLVS